MEKRQTETSTGENLVSSVEEALKLRGEGPVIETLKLNGMDHDKACRFVERVMLIKSGYYSLPSEIKRFFGVLDTRNADNLLTILYKHLLYVGLYGSQEEIKEPLNRTVLIRRSRSVEILKRCRDGFCRLSLVLSYFFVALIPFLRPFLHNRRNTAY